eukprot:3425381-Pyramimonas_sp.AAC.1
MQLVSAHRGVQSSIHGRLGRREAPGKSATWADYQTHPLLSPPFARSEWGGTNAGVKTSVSQGR